MANAVELAGGSANVTASFASTLINTDGSLKTNVNEYPASATVLHSTVTSAAAGAISASFAASASLTNYLQGFAITGTGATTSSVFTATIAGLIGGTMSVPVVVTTGTLVANVSIFRDFVRAIPASAANISLTLNLPSLGAGNSLSIISMYGYRAP